MIGVFSAYLDHGVVTAEVVAAIEQTLLATAPAIATALEQEQLEVVDAGLVEQHNLLRTLAASNQGDTIATVAGPVCDYLLRGIGSRHGGGGAARRRKPGAAP